MYIAFVSGLVYRQTLERMIEVPMIDDVLVVPYDLTRIGIQCECGVVIGSSETAADKIQ
jgi:hypothetical protein